MALSDEQKVAVMELAVRVFLETKPKQCDDVAGEITTIYTKLHSTLVSDSPVYTLTEEESKQLYEGMPDSTEGA